MGGLVKSSRSLALRRVVIGESSAAKSSSETS